MRGNGGSDILEGGSGNDLLEGGGFFSDTYIFRKGHGHDTVRDYAANDSQTDTLRFTGASAKKAVFVRRGNDLVVKVYDSDDQVTLQDYFASSNGDRYRFQFDDATLGKTDIAKRSFFFSGTEKSDVINGWQSNDTIYGRDGNDRIFGNAGNDTLHGDAGDDTLYGNEGDDRLLGGEGNDTLDGGNDNDQLEGGVGNDILRGQAGSDTLEGGAGDDTLEGGGFFSDTYVFYTGHGRDTVRDYAANDAQADTLRFVGTKAKNVVFSREGNDLVVKAYGRDDQVTLKDYFASSNGDRYHFRFDDTTLGKADIIKQTSPKAPTAGKPLTAQSIHEKQRLTYTLAEDAFHTANQDDKLAYSARLADGKPLPRWLSFNAATRTFSGTPGNDDVGMLNIEVSAKGKGGSASQRLTLNVINVNDAPQIGAAIANHTSESGKPLQYRLPANAFKDIDKGDVLTLSAKLENGQPLPSWLSFDGKTGQFSGTPPSSRTANNYRIAVTATDKGGLSARQNFTLSTKPAANQPPRVAINLPVQKMNEKSRWQYTIPANAFHDADGDSLSYSATQADGKPLPKWLNFNAANRTFSGTPGNDDVGNLALRITASDNRGGVASQNLALQIANVNDAPQIGTTIANHTSESGKPLQYRLPSNAFKDIDKGDALTLSAKLENGQPLPSWLSFDEKTGQFSGTPPSSRTANNYRIAVTATDKGGLSARQNFTLSTKPAANQPPRVAINLPVQKMNEKSRWQYTIPANAFHDADGDSLSYSATQADGKPLPKWLNFNAANRTFSGTPGNDDVGNLALRITASDNRGGVASQNLALQIANVNDAPRVWAPFPLHSVNSGESVKFNPLFFIRDMDKDDKLAVSAEMYDGKPLPTWLTVDSKTGILTGTLPFVRETKDYYIRITVTDKAGASTSDVLLVRGEFKKGGRKGTNNDDLLKGALPGRNMDIYGYGGNDTIAGGEFHDSLYGGEGNDFLSGMQGHDILDGGEGNDTLDGGSGNDTYYFARGFGYDVINNYDTGVKRYDSIVFSDMKRSDFDIRRAGNNLVLRSKDGKGQITVTNHFFNGWQIDSIRFADGTTLNYNTINSLTGTQNAPRGNYMHPAAQVLQMNQAAASLNSQAQPLDALAIPDEKQPLLTTVNPY